MSEAGGSETTTRPRPSRWHEPEAIRGALIALVGAFVIGGASYYGAWTADRGRGRELDIKLVETLTSARGRDRELDVKLIEIGIAILRADPKDENTAKIRRWAIEVVEKNSRLPFTSDEKAELLGKAVKTMSNYSDDWGGSDGWGREHFAPDGGDRQNPASNKPSK